MFLRHPLLVSWRVEHGFGTIDSPSRPDCFTARQIHGTDLIRIGETVFGQEPPAADGLLSDNAGFEAGVWTADCLPVPMASENGKRVAAIHAGWRGATSGIVLKGLETFLAEDGTLPVDLRVVLGPAIGPCCFDVGPDVWEAVRSGTGSYRQEDRRTLDLWGLITCQLAAAGVPEDRIGKIPLCTRCHPALFFSHRGMGSARQGRSMLNFIRPVKDDCR